MQKFVVKKISRSTNITIGAEESLMRCCDVKPQKSEDLEVSSVKMCGYLKKKRNRVGGWNKLYFVLQNSLLMSYNSKDEYERQLVSFKDVICLIPGNTVLLPSLEPRFTIASNQHTFYTFRCDDNKIRSKWITAILECLSRDIDLEGTGLKAKSPTKNFHSQQNLCHQHKPIFSGNHSWENLPNNNWIVNHNGRILLELNYLNCNRAKLPIGEKTAKILQKFTDSDVIATTTKKVNFIQNDENENFIRNADHNESHRDGEKFILHDKIKPKLQLQNINRINEMFGQKSESQRPEKLTQQSNGNIDIENGIEEQVQAMSFGNESNYSEIPGDISGAWKNTNGGYQSIDSKKLDQKLMIELSQKQPTLRHEPLPVYATVNINKKHEERLKKKYLKKTESAILENQSIYEEVGPAATACSNEDKDEANIYEPIDLPLRPSRKSRSLVWKNWSRIHLFDFTKRFKDTSTIDSRKPPSPETISKREKASLTLTDLSKRFNYRSMRNKARKMCNRNQSALVTSTNADQKSDKNETAAAIDKPT